MIKMGEYTVDLISEEVLEGFTIRMISILEQRVRRNTVRTLIRDQGKPPNKRQ